MTSPPSRTRRALVRAGAGVLALIATGMRDAKAADIAAGEAAFVRQCALCHTISKTGPNRYGPNLFGIVGRKAGSVAGFHYSPAFKSTASWDWNEEALGGWISSPRSMVPGTTMGVFQGVADRDRSDIIAYLASQK
jgi:cytochrome c